MKPLPSTTLLLALGLGMAAPAGAQSFGGMPVAPEEHEEAPATAKKEDTSAPAKQPAEAKPIVVDEKAAELARQPSRYAGIDTETYVEVHAQSFAMRNRMLDPFARHQDPNFKPKQPARAARKIKKLKKEPVTPFSDIIQGIQVTTVIPARGTFMVGNRTFRVGQRIPLRMTNGKEIPLHVVQVGSQFITFRNGTTGEVANLSLAIMPEGMRRGEGEMTPPGLIEQNHNAPLVIDSPNPLSQSR